MGVLGDIVNLVDKLHSQWRKRVDGRTVAPDELFENFVEPSYQLLRQVHRDYLELYVELSQRITLNGLSSETFFWFSKARVKMQAERSELRFTDFPMMIDAESGASDINEATIQYMASLQNYFISDPDFPRQVSRSLHTETALSEVLSVVRGKTSEKAVDLAEERIRKELKLGARGRNQVEIHKFDDMVDRMLALVTDDTARHGLEREISERRDRVVAALRGVGEKVDLDVEENYPFMGNSEDWEARIQRHVTAQTTHLETAMSLVQRFFFQLKVLCDTQ